MVIIAIIAVLVWMGETRDVGEAKIDTKLSEPLQPPVAERLGRKLRLILRMIIARLRNVNYAALAWRLPIILLLWLVLLWAVLIKAPQIIQFETDRIEQREKARAWSIEMEQRKTEPQTKSEPTSWADFERELEELKNRRKPGR